MILDNIIKGKYTAPSGKSIYIEAESFERSSEHEVDIETIPSDNKVIVKDLGLSEWTYPIKALFFEPNCEKKADYFVELLSENGTGVLIHPVWGEIKVQPVSFSETLDINTEIGIVKVSVDFVKVENVYFGVSNEITSIEIENSLNDLQVFESKNYTKPSQNIYTEIKKSLLSFKEVIKSISSKSKYLQSFLLDIEKEIDEALNTLFTSQVLAAYNIITLLRTPARVASSLYTKLSGYKKYAEYLFELPLETLSEKKTQNLLAVATGISGIQSVLNGEFLNKEDTLSTTLLLSDFKDLIFKLLEKSEGKIKSAISEQKNAGVYFSSDSETKRKLDYLFTLASNLLLNALYKLPSKRIIVIDRDRNYIELFYELKKSLDGLDEFIKDNDFQGDEFYVLSAGRRIVYYND